MDMVDTINIITEAQDGNKQERKLWGVDTIAIHRIQVDGVHTPLGIVKQFLHDPVLSKVTGGQNPYTIYIAEDGTRWQATPLSEISHHARVWNTSALGIACMGDFTKEPPTPKQYNSLVDLCADLAPAFGIHPGVGIKGHDELPEGSSNPDKQCPGKFLPMHQLRQDVTDMIQRRAQQVILLGGLEL